jgi:hypothetical protein
VVSLVAVYRQSGHKYQKSRVVPTKRTPQSNILWVQQGGHGTMRSHLTFERVLCVPFNFSYFCTGCSNTGSHVRAWLDFDLLYTARILHSSTLQFK